jgi:16S rRNA (cytosine967-C5)-methyltransferase
VGEPTAELVDLQAALVLAAASTVRPGGRLLYSVCTLTAVETTGVAARVLDALGADFEVLDPPPAPWRPWGPGALLLPHAAGTDGMFVLALRRVPGPTGPGR